jgi:hypothetical protein
LLLSEHVGDNIDKLSLTRDPPFHAEALEKEAKNLNLAK